MPLSAPLQAALHRTRMDLFEVMVILISALKSFSGESHCTARVSQRAQCANGLQNDRRARTGISHVVSPRSPLMSHRIPGARPRRPIRAYFPQSTSGI